MLVEWEAKDIARTAVLMVGANIFVVVVADIFVVWNKMDMKADEVDVKKKAMVVRT